MERQISYDTYEKKYKLKSYIDNHNLYLKNNIRYF